MAENRTNNQEPCVRDEVGLRSDGYRYFATTYVIFNFMLIPISLILWFKLRSKSMYLLQRCFVLVLVLSLGFICHILTGPLTKVSNDANSVLNSCFLSTFSYFMVVPCFLTAAVGRLVMYLNRYNYNMKLSEAFKTTNYCRGTFESKDVSGELSKLRKKAEESYISRKVIIILSCNIIISLIFTIGSCPELGVSTDCKLESFGQNKVIAFSFCGVTAGTFGLIHYINKKVQEFPDPFGILKEIRSGVILGMVFIVPSSILASLNVGDFNNKDPHRFDFSITFDLGFCLIFYYTVPFQIYISTKSKKMLNGTSFADVLRNEIGRSLFRQHLVNEFSVENLNFMETVDIYLTLFEESREKVEISLAAKTIVDTFIRSTGTSCLNISSQFQKEVERRFDNGEFSKDLFDSVYNEIFTLVANDSFSRFCQTEEFKDYVGTSQVVAPF